MPNAIRAIGEIPNTSSKIFHPWDYVIKNLFLTSRNFFILEIYLLSLIFLLCPVFTGLFSQNASAVETSAQTIIKCIIAS
jgi:hypothetical protein